LNLESLDDVSVLPLVLEEPASTPHVVPPAWSTDDRIDTLVGVVIDLVSRVDSTQCQLDNLQLTLSTPLADYMARYSAQGAIPRNSVGRASVLCSSVSWTDQHMPELHAAPGEVQHHMPTLPELCADQGAVQQAAKLVDSMDLGATGNTNINSTKIMRRGWTRQGGDFAPWVNEPWPQDFVIGMGWNAFLMTNWMCSNGTRGAYRSSRGSIT
jgi:hypothetical protein